MNGFVLQHVHEFSDGGDDVKMIGVYFTHEEAELAADRSRNLPGFHDAPEGFCIDRYVVDEDHRTEGYVTVPPLT